MELPATSRSAAPTRTASVDQGIAFYESNVNGNMPPTRKNVRRSTATEPWGAYYRTLRRLGAGLHHDFTGPQDGVAPYSAPYEWYSGLGNMLQRTLERHAHAACRPARTLSFMTWYDIEQDWDYGYVEASSDGVTWTKLPSSSALPARDANLNGSTGLGRPRRPHRQLGGWQQAQFRSGRFSGDVHLASATSPTKPRTAQGWYVDDIRVGAVHRPVDTTNGWTTRGWLFTTGLQNNDWTADAYVPFAKAASRAIRSSRSWARRTGLGGSPWMPASTRRAQVYGIVSNRPDGTFPSLRQLTPSSRASELSDLEQRSRTGAGAAACGPALPSRSRRDAHGPRSAFLRTGKVKGSEKSPSSAQSPMTATSSSV